MSGQRHVPAALPPGKTRYPLYRTLGGPQRRSGRVWKISPALRFDPRPVQLVASRCTDWAILAHVMPALVINRCATKYPAHEFMTSAFERRHLQGSQCLERTILHRFFSFQERTVNNNSSNSEKRSVLNYINPWNMEGEQIFANALNEIKVNDLCMPWRRMGVWM